MLEKMTKLGDFAAIKFMKAAYTRRKANQSLSFFATHSLSHSHSHSNTVNPSPAFTTSAPKKHQALLGLGHNDLQDAVELFNGMVQTRPLPHISQFNKALGTITRMGHYATALFLIHNLQFLQGIQVDLYTFSIAINCYCHLNRVHFGFSILGTLFKCGYTPNVYIFSTLINGLILEDKTPEAVELFKKLMRNREIEPNVVMYGTIVNGLCRTGNTIRAVSLLRIMEKGSCKPNTIVYSMIIDGLCKDRMADDALKLFFKMKEEGIRPDVVTYTSLIDGLCSFGRWTEAFGMLREMLGSDISPNICTFMACLIGRIKA
ncbi:hypothetical protein TEA_015076 [Camellia sinensis var. sinensis]|uniref:Pentacotripeptide-repeat region of PRORP domain-containing protein n=1 Tax=Camellia sinensis var. sinensis TaxID=542762 RepID=A0A4S4DYA2_CAMSN|nr:hypothetical protein TEA_015076 [Camellia sinensis var. sinensis]